MRVFVGSVKSISPAFGEYKLDLYQSIDSIENKLVGFNFNAVITGIAVTGVIS